MFVALADRTSCTTQAYLSFPNPINLLAVASFLAIHFFEVTHGIRSHPGLQSEEKLSKARGPLQEISTMDLERHVFQGP